MTIVISRQAQKDLEMIYHYISSEGYPETAHKYINRIFTFINELSLIGFAQFKPCRNKSWRKHGFECGIFEEKYIVGYKRVKDEIQIMRILHGSRIK
jgi:plasmid stabilization system protein ParE